MGTGNHEFIPRWEQCVEAFADESGLSSQENEQHHYLKHVVGGAEWIPELSLQEYCILAQQHLNTHDHETVIELCQVEDQSVVKYNLDTGELGIARRRDGKIKTFFRPGTFSYVVRKLEQGLWGNPDIVNGYTKEDNPVSFDDDIEKVYLYNHLQSLALDLPETADMLLVNFTGRQLNPEKTILLLAHIAQCRFYSYELEQRILTEDQEDAVEELERIFLRAAVIFDVIERTDISLLTKSVQQGIEEKIRRNETLWKSADSLILESEDLETALMERDLIGFAMMELRIMQRYDHLPDFSLHLFSHRLRKSDIYLHQWLYPLVKKFSYKELQLAFPEDFFWRKTKL